MIDSTLDSLATRLVMADASDVGDLSGLRSDLEQARTWAQERSDDDLSSVITSAIDQLADLISSIEGSDDGGESSALLGPAVLELVSAAVSHLQSNLREDELSARDVEEDDGDDDLLAAFLSDQEDHISEIESALIGGEDGVDEEELTGVRGRLHTLKGEAGVLDMPQLSELYHRLEDVLEERQPAEAHEIVLSAIDWVRSYVGAISNGQAAPEPFVVPGESAAAAAPAPVAVEPEPPTPAEVPEAELIPETAPEVEPVAEQATPEAPADEPADAVEPQPEAAIADEVEQPEAAATEGDPAALDAFAAAEAAVAESGSELTEVEPATPAAETAAAPEPTAADPVEPAPVAAPKPAAPIVADPIFSTPVAVDAEPELAGDFVVEAREHLEEVDAQLLVLEKSPGDAEAVNCIFRAFHTIKGLAGFLELDCIKNLAHEAETMLDAVRGGSLTLNGPPLEATFASNDALKVMVDGVQLALETGQPLVPPGGLDELVALITAVLNGEDPPPVSPPSGEQPGAVEEHDDASAIAAEAVDEEDELQGDNVDQQTESSEVAQQPDAPSNDAADTEAADTGAEAPPAKPDAPAGRTEPGKKVEVRETIKVDAQRLDALVDMIGELVIAEAMVSRSDELDLDSANRLPSLFAHMDKITRELQELAMSLRMVPIRSTFRRMARLARDVASKLDKRIDFVTRGEETELDKTVVDSIGDPLVHMVRNAVDHGLEDCAEDRIAVGKKPIGNVELRAFHRGGNIHIEIEDDGRGLDRDRILAKAIERGIIEEGEMISDNEIYALIFAPGFSTAKQLTDVSGRGVGLDVVKRDIQALRGSVEIRSNKGKGTVFSIRLPLTLAIIDGMVVRVGRERYVLPTAAIVRMIRPETDHLKTVLDQGEMLIVGEELVPLHRLYRILGIEDAVVDETRASAVMVEHENRTVAFLVDELLGQQQIVIKPLGPTFTGTRGLAGGAIMPDGQVGLILDIAGLVELALHNESIDSSIPNASKGEAVKAIAEAKSTEN